MELYYSAAFAHKTSRIRPDQRGGGGLRSTPPAGRWREGFLARVWNMADISAKFMVHLVLESSIMPTLRDSRIFFISQHSTVCVSQHSIRPCLAKVV